MKNSQTISEDLRGFAPTVPARPSSLLIKFDYETAKKLGAQALKALKALNMVKSNEQAKSLINKAKTGKALKALIILI